MRAPKQLGPQEPTPAPRCPSRPAPVVGALVSGRPHPLSAGLRSEGLGWKRSALCAFEGEGDRAGQVHVPGPHVLCLEVPV